MTAAHVEAPSVEMHRDMMEARALLKSGGRPEHSLETLFRRWFRQRCVEGHPPDSLDRHIKDETQRFFSKTLQGSDGHVFWNGVAEFERNDGTRTKPRRWWYFHHLNRASDRYLLLRSSCGESRCISPHHQNAISRKDAAFQRYTDEQLLAIIQNVAMRLGHVPGAREYDAQKLGVSRATIAHRFGSWNAAIKAAGFTARRAGGQAGMKGTTLYTREGVLLVGRELVKTLGRFPGQREWDRKLRISPHSNTITRMWGEWRLYKEEVLGD